jgi:glycosyltransferase involved in cell wall biosynthesis
MKILISRLTKELGGAELSAKDHATVLRNVGHDVLFVTNYPQLRGIVREKSISTRMLFWIHPQVLRPLLFPLLFTLNILKAFFMLTYIRPDTVNPHSRDDQIVFTLLKPIFKYRVVWKDAGDMHFQLQQSRHSLPARLYERVYKYTIRKSDGVYFLNKSNESEAIGYVSELKGKTRVIKSDMLFENFTISEKTQRDSLIIGTAIRLVEDKYVDMLIKVFANIHKSNPTTKLWIVGDGALRGQLETLVRELGLKESVKFHGYQPDPSYWYSNFDIFVQPALYEPWGRNIKEAKYFGLPIIGSATDGISKQISDGKTGLLFKPGDAKDLEEKLTRLIANKQLRYSLGSEAKKAALEEGDFNDLIRKEIFPFLAGESR